MRLLAAMLGLVLAACQPLAPAPARPVTLGFVAALSGPEGPAGQAALEAARLAASEVNEAGGVNGQPLAILARDAAGKAGDVAEGLAGEGVVALLTGGDAATREVVTHVAGPRGLPVIAPVGAPLWDRGAGEPGLVFRTAPPDRDAAKAIAQAVEADGHPRVALLTRDRPAIRAMAEEIELLLGERRASLAIYEDIDAPEADAVLAEVPHDATAVVFLGLAPDAAVLLKQWAAGPRRDLRWYFHPGMKDPALAALAGARRLEGQLGAAPIGGGAGYAAFAAAYAARTGRMPSPSAAHAYDAVMLAALAMAKGEANTPEALRSHLVGVSRAGEPPRGRGAAGFKAAVAAMRAGLEVDYDGASGPLDLDDKGEARSDYVVWRWQGGRPHDTARRLRL